MEETQVVPEDQITIDDFMKVKLRVARVLDAAPVPDSDKLMRLDLVVGEEKRQVLAGIAQQYSADDLIGRQVVGVINFPEKQIGPFRSEFLLTGFPTDDGVVVTAIERPVPNGTRMA